MELYEILKYIFYTGYSGKVWLDIVDSGNVYELGEVEDYELLYSEVVGITLKPNDITISVAEET